MSNQFPLGRCRAARFPASALSALAPLRAKGGARVIANEMAWVEWEGERADIVGVLMVVSGVEFFEQRDGKWFIIGSHLPTFDVPVRGAEMPLDRAVIPAAFVPIDSNHREHSRVPLALKRCERLRPTTAIRCSVSALREWAESAPTGEISAIQGARNGDVAWLIGSALPAIPDAERFWGERVLIPLGFRAEPDWPESALREAANVGANEILVLTQQFTEAIPEDAFRPLTRAAIRRAIR